MKPFVGRIKELNLLKQHVNQGIAKLIIVKGRRRIGKSRLLQEFGASFNSVYSFSGLPPEPSVTAQQQRLEFSRQLKTYFGIKNIQTDDWGDLFWHLSEETKHESCLIILDELSWMAQDEPVFLPKLKVAWDLYFKKNPKCIVALCSSISLWIEENVLSSTGFMGRQSLVLKLDELSLRESMQFWQNEQHISVIEKLKLLAVTGGIPRYLEEINLSLTAEQNIKNLCFSTSGILFNEFEKIFSDLFGNDKALYREILIALSNGAKEAADIFKQLKLGSSGRLYQHLENLNQAGFISIDYTWNTRSGTIGKIKYYRLSDNYCRFYLKYIYPNRSRIEANHFFENSVSSLPGWSSIMGLQVENLVLNNRTLIFDALGLSKAEIIADNPYNQRATQRRPGVQIDYLIQSEFNNLFLCEIKFTKKTINNDIIDEVENKIEKLKIPKGFSVRPVLIHCGNVSESVEDAKFFSTIINFTNFLRH